MKATEKLFPYATMLASLILGTVAAAQTRTTCFTAVGTENPFDVPLLSITYPEPEIAVLHLNGKNIYSYMKKRADLNPGTIELDKKIDSIAKYPIPCRYDGKSQEFPPRIQCQFSDRYSISLFSYTYDGQLVTVSDLVVSEPQYDGAFSWGPRLFCKESKGENL